MAQTQPYPLPKVPSYSEEEEKEVAVKFIKEAVEQQPKDQQKQEEEDKEVQVKIAKEDQQKHQEEEKDEVEVKFTKIAVEQQAKEDEQQQQEEGGDAKKQEKLGGVDKGKRPMGESSTTTPGLKTNDDDDDDGDGGDGNKSAVSNNQKIMAIPTIIIEYCLSETLRSILEPKAQELKEELEAAIMGIKVKINPELSTIFKGGFRVRSEEDGKIWKTYDSRRSSPLEVLELDVSQLVNEVKSSIRGSKDA